MMEYNLNKAGPVGPSGDPLQGIAEGYSHQGEWRGRENRSRDTNTIPIHMGGSSPHRTMRLMLPDVHTRELATTRQNHLSPYSFTAPSKDAPQTTAPQEEERWPEGNTDTNNYHTLSNRYPINNNNNVYTGTEHPSSTTNPPLQNQHIDRGTPARVNPNGNGAYESTQGSKGPTQGARNLPPPLTNGTGDPSTQPGQPPLGTTTTDPYNNTEADMTQRTTHVTGLENHINTTNLQPEERTQSEASPQQRPLRLRGGFDPSANLDDEDNHGPSDEEDIQEINEEELQENLNALEDARNRLTRPPRTRGKLCIASMNIRGAGGDGSKGKWTSVNQIMRDKRIAIMAIQETHGSERLAREVESLYNRLKVFHSEYPLELDDGGVPNPRTAAKGIAIVINREILYADDIANDSRTEIIPGQAMTMSIPWNDKKIQILAIYAPNDAKQNGEFWKELGEFWRNNPQIPNPDVMIGDFNVVEEAMDRLPSRPDRHISTVPLLDLKQQLSLTDGWRRAHQQKQANIECSPKLVKLVKLVKLNPCFSVSKRNEGEFVKSLKKIQNLLKFF